MNRDGNGLKVFFRSGQYKSRKIGRRWLVPSVHQCFGGQSRHRADRCAICSHAGRDRTECAGRHSPSRSSATSAPGARIQVSLFFFPFLYAIAGEADFLVPER